jgi:hypothetical protein
MAPETLTILVKGCGMILAMFGGIYVARYGFLLYKSGAGAGRDSVAFEISSIRIKAHSVGSAAICTAFLWVWAGVALSPNLEKEKDSVHVYSFSVSGNEVEAESILAPVQVSYQARPENPEDLVKNFRTAITSKTSIGNYALKINGEPAKYDPNSIGIESAHSGEYMLTAKAETASSSVNLSFKPVMSGKQLTFIPKATTNASSDH